MSGVKVEGGRSPDYKAHRQIVKTEFLRKGALGHFFGAVFFREKDNTPRFNLLESALFSTQ